MKKKTILWISLIAIAAIGIYFVWNAQKENTTKDKEVVEIGVILPLTGPVAEPGQNALRGIQIAKDIFNAKVGNNRKIKLIIEDSKSDPKIGVSAINKLFFTDNIKIIIGDLMSSVFLACAPIAEKNKIVTISPGASAPNVKNAGDYIFRNYLSDDFDGKVMANYIIKKERIKDVGIISVNNDYGVGVNKSFLESVKELGGNIVFNEQYGQGETNFKTILSLIKGKKFEAIYMVCNPVESGHLVKQIREVNIKQKLFGNLTFENNEFINVAKGSFDEIVFSAPFLDLEENNHLTRLFVKNYMLQYGRKPDIAAALGFDVLNIIMDALIRNNFNIETLKDELYNTDIMGVTGRTTFDRFGDVLKDIYIKKITSNGKIVIIDKFDINE